MVYDIGDSDERNVNGGGGVGGENIYKGRAEPVLVSLSDSYSKLNLIFVGISRPSSCPTSHYLLTIFYLLF